MAFKHGIYIYEEPTGILPPVRVNSAMPVALVTAPVHLAEDPYAVTNEPQLLFTHRDAVRAFGMSMRPEIWDNYTAPQVIHSMFALYGVAPLVMINVLDPKIHNTAVQNNKLALEGYSAVLSEKIGGTDESSDTGDNGGDSGDSGSAPEQKDVAPRALAKGVLIDTVTVKNATGEAYKVGVHYTLTFNRDGHIVINAIEGVADGITENELLEFAYTKLAPEKVDIYDIIGGYNIQTGKNEGAELIEEVFPRFRLVPGQILAPGFTSDPAVAAVLETRAGNINGHFRCILLCDMPTMIENAAGELVQHRFTYVPAWKNQNNYVSTRQLNLYPKLRLGNQIYHYSSQMAGLIARVDSENSGTPYHSPSNQNLRMNGLCYADGEELILNTNQANFLNSQGIVAAINFTRGWVAWGNRTGIFPGSTDPKDAFIPIRRMFDWVGNTIIITYWSRIDAPITPRRITTIMDSVNIWLNGLTAREFILGGRLEFLQDDNPDTDILDGMVTFRLRFAPPPPKEAINVIMEYDPAYLQTLFSS